MRASDDDRAKVQEVLNGAFAEGRLTQQEWEQRANELATAKTYADLERLTADLPGHSLVPQYAPPGPLEPRQAPRRTNGVAVAALVCGIGQVVAFWPATILAIVLGHKARRDIRRTGEQGTASRWPAWPSAISASGSACC
jgi:ferric-dicitrate binding protein FerR (iron transport regulator)